MNFSRMTFPLEIRHQLSPVNCLKCLHHGFPNEPQLRPQRLQFLDKFLQLWTLQPHTLACYLLCFARVFYFMPLLIQVFPAPISVVTKEAVENQWAQSWETGVSPAYPLDPLGTGLLSVTWSLTTLSKPAWKCKWELVCSPKSRLKMKRLVLFTLGRKADRQ